MKMKVLVVLMMFAIAASPAWAEIIRGIDIDFVTIGNPGNPGDTRTDYPNSADPYGCGAVGYRYRIGKYEVTNSQWDTFVTAAGAPTGNLDYAYDRGAVYTGTNIPTNMVSWYEATQFCNYLTSGDKSKGAYLFSGDNTDPGDFLGIDRTLAVSTYGTTYVLPTEDEWYKAAYYKPDGGGYSTYSNGLNTVPDADNGWNYSGGSYDSPWDVGTGTMEQNGTFDMMGNVDEWNETLVVTISNRRVRGGAYGQGIATLRSAYNKSATPYHDYGDIGFRIVAIPEPTSLLLLSLGALLLRRRK